ncbi:MAG: hypothetical protein F6K23_36865 [Okeania sp. SIO2C9]|uniref:hypothetical protein n=1 Tax=Okeania sp. SIO2C9 TaxID=2607791 RepID=UPI0013C10F9B|nr:hypothetical protein [Okeania sp. SIO2C9]NEQ78083.1 hypothetical protein [Okeania sp. SIO2C9]
MKLQQRAIPRTAHTTPHQCATGNSSGNLPPNKRHQRNNNTQTPGERPNKESRLPIANATGKFQYKPVGGSGWLNKYTSWKSTQNGYVEYPRIKEETWGTNELKHWYWKYCWRSKGSKKIESIGCPIKKVRAVERAIAANLTHKEIYNFIVEDKSAPPPT